MWQNMLDYQIINNNPCPHINAEVPQVSTMDYTIRIFLLPLVLVVNNADAVSNSSVKSTNKK
jgi:hypothetical protein